MLICFAQLGQLLISVPYAVLRQAIYPDGNSVGIDANVAYYGLGLIMFAVFDFIFLIVFYKILRKNCCSTERTWRIKYIYNQNFFPFSIPFRRNLLFQHLLKILLKYNRRIILT